MVSGPVVCVCCSVVLVGVGRGTAPLLKKRQNQVSGDSLVQGDFVAKKPQERNNYNQTRSKQRLSGPWNYFIWILTTKGSQVPDFVRHQWQAGMFHFCSQWEVQFKELSSWMCEKLAGSGSLTTLVNFEAADRSWSFCADTVSWPGKTIPVISLALIVSIHNFKGDGCKNEEVVPASFWAMLLEVLITKFREELVLSHPHYLETPSVWPLVNAGAWWNPSV